MGFMVKNSHILQLLGVNECFNTCSHLVLVGLGLGNRLAIVGIPRGGTFGKALALTILNHIDTLKDGSAVYLQQQNNTWVLACKKEQIEFPSHVASGS